jgi:hypothetical protein
VSFCSDWFVATQPAFSHIPDWPAANTLTAALEMDATNMNATATVKANTVFFIVLPLSKKSRMLINISRRIQTPLSGTLVKQSAPRKNSIC